jgi:mevalonate kinase
MSSQQLQAPCQISVHGKWVLTGEHAVMRGQTAIVLPYPDSELTLEYHPQLWDDLKVSPSQAQSTVDALLALVSAVRTETATSHEGGRAPLLRGSLTIESTIPQGAGFGSSAALCVALARLLKLAYGWSDSETNDWAVQFENHFHGKSSGMDVAAVQAGAPILYSIHKKALPLRLRVSPYFTFHDTGLRSSTKECVAQVASIIASDPKRGEWLDEKMGSATRTAMDGLTLFSQGRHRDGVLRIASGMKQAHSCFVDWDLCPEVIQTQIDGLLAKGALAAKMTGSGRGGFIVALWPEPTVLPRAASSE